jgi:hypothetical protein
MPSYFFRNHQNGLLVTSHNVKLDVIQKYLISPSFIWIEKEVVFKNGIKRNIKSKTEFKIGFFPVSDLEELDYKFGDEVPVSITKTLVIQDNESSIDSSNQLKIYWADYEDDSK